MIEPAASRRDYAGRGLDERDVVADPIVQFRAWFDEAAAAGATEPTAMALATATPDGRPSLRMVLLKAVDERGFTFFTNTESRKGRELAANPRAALVFRWEVVERQVRVAGTVELLAAAEADRYFATRPLGARIGAWASPQSAVISGRQELERRAAAAAARFGDDVPRPPQWGGYVVMPDEVELWQGRPDRLHDRLRYRRSDDGWLIERLAP